MRYGCAHAWVGICVPLACTIFKVIFSYAIELSSIYFSEIAVIHDISKQIEQHVHIGKIFARWHLAIAITSIYTGMSYFVIFSYLLSPDEKQWVNTVIVTVIVINY